LHLTDLIDPVLREMSLIGTVCARYEHWSQRPDRGDDFIVVRPD